MKYIISLTILCFVITVGSAQLKTPSASPLQTLTQEFATSKITIVYSRPAKKGRQIFGELVPYKEVWRTGANMATTIRFEEDVKINGTPLKAGHYALFSIPDKNEWTLVFNKNVQSWGINNYSKDEDVLRLPVKPIALKDPVEVFTFQVFPTAANSANVEFAWDNVKVQFTVSAEVDSKIMAQIDEAMKSDKKPYYDAAMYYFENDKDLSKAIEWIEAAVKQNPEAYWIHHAHAKMLMKAKRYQEAIPAAQRSKELAGVAGNKDYVRFNDQIIAEANKTKK